MYVQPIIPATLAARRRSACRHAGAAALLVAGAAALTPVAWALSPLLLARAHQSGARRCAIVAGLGWLAAGSAWIDLRALAAYPAVVAGPWLALLAGAMATAGAWAQARHRGAHEVLRAAAILALVAAPWSPATGLIVALACWLLAPHRAVPVAANDNQPARRLAVPAYALTPLTYPPLRPARPAAFD